MINGTDACNLNASQITCIVVESNQSDPNTRIFTIFRVLRGKKPQHWILFGTMEQLTMR